MCTCAREHAQAESGGAQVKAGLEALCAAPDTGGGAQATAWADRDECVVCMDAPRTTRLRPCFHVLLCPACAANMVRDRQPCPTCRVPVERYEEGYFFATYVPLPEPPT
jgi:hypothetical protein